MPVVEQQEQLGIADAYDPLEHDVHEEDPLPPLVVYHTEAEAITARSYPVASGVWQPTDATGTTLATLSFPAALRAQRNIDRFFDSGVYFSFKSVVVTLLYAMPAGLAGQLMLGHLPYGETQSITTLGSLANYPHVLPTSDGGLSSQLRVPWIFPKPVASFDEVIARVQLMVALPLLSATSATPGSVPWTLQAQFEDLRIHGVGDASTIPAVVPQGRSEGRHAPKRNATQSAAEAAAMTTSATESGPASFVTGAIKEVGEVAEAVSSILPLAAMALDRPVDEEAPKPMVPTFNQDMTNAGRLAIAPSLTPHIGAATDNTAKIWGGDDAPTALECMLAKPSLSIVTTMDSTSALVVPVHPMFAGTGIASGVTTGTTTMPMTASRWAVFHHQFWRGSMEFLLHVAAPTLVQGRLRVRYFPGTSANTLGTALAGDFATDVMTQVYQITGNTCIAFSVPWTRDAMWDKVAKSIDTLRDTACNGCLYIDFLDQLTGPDPAVDPNIGVMLYSRAGPDFQLRLPYLPEHTTAASAERLAERPQDEQIPPDLDVEVKPQMRPEQGFLDVRSMDPRAVPQVLEGLTLTGDGLDTLSEACQWATPVYSNFAEYRATRTASVRLWPYLQHTQVWSTRQSGGLVKVAPLRTFLAAMGESFAYYKGGFVIQAMYASIDRVTARARVIQRDTTIVGTSVQPDSVLAGYPTAFDAGATGRLSFKVPYLGQTAFYVTQADPFASPTEFPRGVDIIFSKSEIGTTGATSNTAPWVDLCISAGDDLAFGFPRGTLTDVTFSDATTQVLPPAFNPS